MDIIIYRYKNMHEYVYFYTIINGRKGEKENGQKNVETNWFDFFSDMFMN